MFDIKEKIYYYDKNTSSDVFYFKYFKDLGNKSIIFIAESAIKGNVIVKISYIWDSD